MYYTLSDILWLSLFFVVLWYIWASMAAKEHVRRAASDHCRQLGVQLLDDTVLLVRTRIKKDKRGFSAFTAVTSLSLLLQANIAIQALLYFTGIASNSYSLPPTT
ncbi:DUF3301 domain-containing protein [Microbulbifer sp. MKSA007]|nr:DUF3301 domain-containing protein [Microbulbifer sp. MKSA007]